MSARLARFAREHTADPKRALAALRADLTASRGPLVEQIEGSDDVQVTFVFIGQADNVLVACQIWPLEAPTLGAAMEQIPGTDVWWVSVAADPAVSTTCQFLLDPPSAGSTLNEALELFADAERAGTYAAALFRSGRRDMFNPEALRSWVGLSAEPDDPGLKHGESVLTLPQAAGFLFGGDSPVRGRIDRHRFPGQVLAGNRDVTVYLPPGYDAAQRYPAVVLLDGEAMLDSGRLHEVLDAAIAAGDIPPLIGVFWHNLTVASRTSEMTCNPALPAALADELWPWLQGQYAVTTDSARTVIAGLSYGGLAAAWVGLERPDIFGAAVIMSPPCWYAPPTSGDGAPEPPGWILRQFEDRERVPLRAYVSVGSLESAPIVLNGREIPSMVEWAHRLCNTLASRGYDVVGYREEPAGHEFVQVRRVLPPALAALLRES